MLYYLGMVALGLFILWAVVRLSDEAAASVYPGEAPFRVIRPVWWPFLVLGLWRKQRAEKRKARRENFDDILG